MQLEVGKIVEGKVTGITKFGAFVELESGEVGMVHISEVAPTYVNDISEHLTDGQAVTVKVLAIGEDKKISLSIKKAMKPEPRRENQSRDFGRKNNGGQNRDFQKNGNRDGGNSQRQHSRPANNNFSRPAAAKQPSSFEDMLSKFMASSDEKISDMKRSREVSRRAGGQRRSK